MIKVSGLIRLEPAASATARGTVPVGPITDETIGKPTPARFGKPIVRACNDASDLDTSENVRTAQYHATYNSSIVRPKTRKSGACSIIWLREADAVAANSDAGNAKSITR